MAQRRSQSGIRGQGRRAESLGAKDPRARRANNTWASDWHLMIGAGLYVDPDGRLAVDPDYCCNCCGDPGPPQCPPGWHYDPVFGGCVEDEPDPCDPVSCAAKGGTCVGGVCVVEAKWGKVIVNPESVPTTPQRTSCGDTQRSWMGL